MAHKAESRLRFSHVSKKKLENLFIFGVSSRLISSCHVFQRMYAQSRGLYYVQLEDDILSAPQSVSKMVKFALNKDASKIDWFILDFCQLGFIGT